MTTPDFQERGEIIRQALGIDGTAGDAQDIPHPYSPDPMDVGLCGACETGLFNKVHEEPQP